MSLSPKQWKKSSYSSPEGQECVEVKLSPWRKSSYSTGTGQECVEVAHASDAYVGIRDSKDRPGTHLFFGRKEWAFFLSALREDQ